MIKLKFIEVSFILELIIILIISILLVIGVNADNTTVIPAACQNFTLFNNSAINNESASYNITLCSDAVKANCNTFQIFNQTTYNQTINITNVFVNQTTNETMNTTEEINVTVQMNYTNTTICTYQNQTFFCPSCPSQDITYFDINLTPKENASSYFQNWTDFCRINVTVGGYPSCFRIVEGQSIIQNDFLYRLQMTAENGSRCCEQVNEIDKTKLFCPIESKSLIEGWESLTDTERTAIGIFVKIQGPVNMWQFADVLYPTANTSSVSQSDATYYANLMLQHWGVIGFAKTECKQQFYADVNVTREECYYSPIINENCLNETSTLVSIKSNGYYSGIQWTLFWACLIAILIFLIIWINSKKQALPWR